MTDDIRTILDEKEENDIESMVVSTKKGVDSTNKKMKNEAETKVNFEFILLRVLHVLGIISTYYFQNTRIYMSQHKDNILYGNILTNAFISIL